MQKSSVLDFIKSNIVQNEEQMLGSTTSNLMCCMILKSVAYNTFKECDSKKITVEFPTVKQLDFIKYHTRFHKNLFGDYNFRHRALGNILHVIIKIVVVLITNFVFCKIRKPN
eukprot:TRINITY_DN31168_c0_g3_i2.p3 TRINITY_DN31168_c0_g3~~TRINITY_DN31168_c0_g3_i2.p3  ORF type:complete len:113 (-),score=0.41 TRINITY_DN31168_c0_g3_i2:265-603(-)